MEQYIYLSYSFSDSKFADRLNNELAKSGFKTWFDKAEIDAGENWQKRMDDGLKNASVLIFVISRNTLLSNWTIYEVKKVLEREGVVIPIIIDDYGYKNIPDFLRQIQHIDFRSSFTLKFKELLKAFYSLSILPSTTFTKAKIRNKSKGYVFLSYCEEDRNFVISLKNYLKKNGYAYWDYEESDRDYHNHLFIELEGAIINAAATLSVLSPHWRRSKWAIREYFFSEEVGKPVFLLKAVELGPTLAIAGVPYIDFTRNINSGYQKLSRELKRKNL